VSLLEDEHSRDEVRESYRRLHPMFEVRNYLGWGGGETPTPPPPPFPLRSA